MSDPTLLNDDAGLSVPSRDLGQRWFGGLIPDLAARSGEFETDLNVLDEELLQLFHEQILLSVEELRQGIGSFDALKIRESAHSLQGMGGVVGAPEISVLGVAFSEAAIAEDWKRCGDLLTALEGWQAEWRPLDAGTGAPLEKMPALKGRILVRMDPETGQVETLSCGHPPPLVMGEDGKVLPGFVEEKGGMPVGMMPAEFGLPYLKEDEVHVSLPVSATMYMYTDGLLEAKTGDGRECGEAGLVASIEQSVRDEESLGDPDDILDRLLAEGYALTADDCTLMNLRRIPPAQVLACGERVVSMEEVDRLSAELAELLTDNDWEDLAVTMVRLLVTEHLANVVKHGRCPTGKLLFYRLTLSPLGCVLVMSDPGIAWDPDHWRREKEKNPERFAESGRGLGMIARICEGQRHFRRDNYNHSVYTLQRNLAERLNEEFASEEDR
jgi:anti-sigma regulatory factor (Ser/Thr protein kinase)/HPt (histidine-containing phosphotransfer) domain-containing protein